MSNTKLLLVASSFYPVHGGAELRFLRYLPFLKKNHIDVEIITGTPKKKKFSAQDHTADWRNAQDGELVHEQEIEDAKMYQYKLPETGAAKRANLLLDQVINRCENRVDDSIVVQLLIPLSEKSISRLQRIRKTGTPLVYSYALAHTFSENSLVRIMQKKKVRRVYKHFNCVIAASSVLKEIVKDIAPFVRVEVIANGIDTQWFSPPDSQEIKAALRQELDLPADATIIALVGAIHPRKGTDLLVDAWTLLAKEDRNLHLLLIGPRYDKTRTELKDFSAKITAAIDTSGVPQNIHFVGQVENVRDHLQASDLFAFPSVKEGMPNAVLEAMATGLPVVLTPFVGLSDDFGKPGHEYILSQRSATELAKAMRTILTDKSLQSKLGRNARSWLKKTMDLNASVQAYANTYRSLTDDAYSEH